MKTINYYEKVKEVPEVFIQLKCKELLFAHYNCPSKDQLLGKWSQHNYILYVISGKLAYHTPAAPKTWLFGSSICQKSSIRKSLMNLFQSLLAFIISHRCPRSRPLSGCAVRLCDASPPNKQENINFWIGRPGRKITGKNGSLSVYIF